MAQATRRGFLAGTAAFSLIAANLPAAGNADRPSVAADLARYIELGNKQSGGDGDNRCGDWLAAELQRAGFAVEKLPLSVPWFEPERCEIEVDAARASLWPQPIVLPTGPSGITGPVVRVDFGGRSDRSVKDAIALVDLPGNRWSSAIAKPIRMPIEAAFAGGARAAAVITNGPTGKVIALNADGQTPMFAGPVGLLAPEAAAPFLAAAVHNQTAKFTLTGQGGRRPAFNLIGRIDRGKGRWVIVSTPRSGWFGCAGERGGGIAAWLNLARWAPAALPDHNLAFLCNSGHEYENLGAEASIKSVAPKPNETQVWLHLGANLAARDWHEGLFGLAPLPGTDSQRYLVVSPPLLPAARRLFAGLAGLEGAYPSDKLSAGELTAIIKAGYPLVAGIFGLHRFHHVAEDDERCVSADAVAETTTAFRNLLREAATA